jgi:hypothetical protein
MSNELDYLGEFIMKHFRDVALECIEGLCEGRFDSPGHRRFQDELASLSASDKKLVQQTLAYCVDGGLNDFLFHLDKAMRSKKKRIQLLVDGVLCTDLTDGLHKKLHGLDGWKEKFSKFESITAK